MIPAHPPRPPRRRQTSESMMRTRQVELARPSRGRLLVHLLMSQTQNAAVPPLPRAFWALWTCHLVNRLGGFVQPFLVLFLTHDRRLTAGMAGAVAAAVGGG